MAKRFRIERIENLTGAKHVEIQDGARIVVGSGLHTPVASDIPLEAVCVLVQTDLEEHPGARYLLTPDPPWRKR